MGNGRLAIIEAMKLVPYAMQAEDSGGRRRLEPPHPYRGEFQRDRDRVIHTKAFRRLEKKTQVFESGLSDHFRNRLTHTIEVAQIARTISQAMRLNSDLCEVLALSHDIGHPPFSHEGEKVLDAIMKKHGSGFEHNLHALRIVEDFEEKYVSFRGLNLTFEVREGIVKHSRDYEKDAQPYLDISEYRLGERPPLEAQLIDFADEIAYNSADIDDGYDSGLLAVEQLVEDVALFGRLYRQVDERFPRASDKLKVSETVRRIIDYLVTRLIESTSGRLQQERVRNVEDVRAFPGRLFAYDPESGSFNDQIKSFLMSNLYDHEELKVARERAQKSIEELFDYYVAHPSALPAAHQARAATLGVHRAACDYIAGMTDSYAILKHREIGSSIESG
jgi:dGTPase